MTTLGLKIGGFAGGLAGVFSRKRATAKRANGKPARTVRTNGRATGKASVSKPAPFQAVEIRRGNGACQAAIDLHGQRFLAREAPTLPLPGCDRGNCGCRFSKLADRRGGEDRRFYDDHSSGFASAVHKDRRNRRDRRRQD